LRSQPGPREQAQDVVQGNDQGLRLKPWTLDVNKEVMSRKRDVTQTVSLHDP
jgi:hypothetical protein